MATGVSIEVDLKDQRIFNKVTDGIQADPMTFLRSAARTLVASWWGETFRLQGARRGHARWKPLSKDYANFKRRKGMPANILHQTGQLLGSNEILEQSRTSLSYGTKVPYAPHHQKPAVRGRPPKREIIFVTEQDRKELSAFLSRLIRKRYERKL